MKPAESSLRSIPTPDSGQGEGPQLIHERDEEDEEKEDNLTPLSPSALEEASHNDLSRMLFQNPEAAPPVLSHKSHPRGGLSPTMTPKSFGSGASQKEVEDLKAKLRVMDKKREEDREKL